MSIPTLKGCLSGESSCSAKVMIGYQFFPDELMTEILQRLHVKSLKRFECVSRSWLSFISSPEFIKAHLQFNKSDANKQRLFMLGYPFNHEESQRHLWYSGHCSLNSLFSNEHDQTVNVFDIEIPPVPLSPQKIVIVGCCDGLVCLATRFQKLDFHLWNPSTRKSHKLPDHLESKDIYYGFGYGCYGFGYDCSTDDYKVVVTIYTFNTGCRVKVYSIKSQSWKRIEDFPHGIPSSSANAVLNSNLHWALHKPANRFIVSLDLATEMYGVLEKPDHYEMYEKLNYPQIGTVGGNLCLSYRNPSRYQTTELWVMKEYGVRESWTKMFSIPGDIDLWGSLWGDLYIKPCISVVNGEYLLVFDRKIGIYSTKNQSFNPFNKLVNQLNLNLNISISSAHCFVESLVLPSAC